MEINNRVSENHDFEHFIYVTELTTGNVFDICRVSEILMSHGRIKCHEGG